MTVCETTFITAATRSLAAASDYADLAARIVALCVPKLAAAAILSSRDGRAELTLTVASPTGAALDDVPIVVALEVEGAEVTLRLAREDGLDDEARADRAYQLALFAPIASLALTSLRRLTLERTELRRRELEQRIILDAVPAMMWFKDDSNRILRANRAAAESMGMRVEDLDGRRTEDLYPEEAAGYQADDLEVIRSGKPKLGIIERYQPIGRAPIWVQTDKVPHLDLDGTVRGVIVCAIDVSAIKEAEESRAELLRRTEQARRDAEQANRAKDEFLATLSHELRTPLTAILSWAHALGMRQSLGEREQARAVAAITRNARAQARLIEDLLDISRIVTGKLQLERASCDLDEVVRAALEAVGPAGRDKQIEIEYAGTPAVVAGDADRLRQVVCNLLTNAVKFTPSAGRVTVRLAIEGERGRLVVSDTGDGIDPSFLPYVFDRFRQADASSSRSVGGLGIGLAIVRHVIERHGGEVSARSEGRGRGATFEILLPLSVGATVSRLPVAVTSARALDGLRVCVVDDDEDFRDALEVILAGAGAEVTTAASTQEVLARLEQVSPHVVVTDIGMPGEDGYSLLRRVRALRASAELPVIALTAYAGVHDEAKALAAGFAAHLAKPPAPEALIERIARLAPRR